MPVVFINSVKSDDLPPREIIRSHFCPEREIFEIERALIRIKDQAVPKKLPMMKTDGFVCKNERCRGTELSVPPTEYPTHKSCIRCGLVYPVVHQGKAYRDIRERADRNTCGITDKLMSDQYNYGGSPNSRDTHIMKARAEFDNISAKLHFNSTPNKAINLFGEFLDGIGKMRNGKMTYKVPNADVVYAACMFHCLTVPFKRKKSRYTTPRKKRRVIHKRPYTKSRANM